MNRATPSTGWARNPDGTLGWTWNPITGCLNGCPYCYARKLANGRLKQRYCRNKVVTTHWDALSIWKPHDGYNYKTEDPFYPRFWPDKLYHPWGGKPKGIFVCDMSDLFGIGIPEQWTKDIFHLIKLHSENRYYLLTKQPQNLIKWSPFPDNCFVGVTVTKPEFFLPALDALDSIQCSVRYLSIEPMLAAFDVPDLSLLLGGSVDWLILGAQTKPYKPPKIEWVEEIVKAADKAGIPVFLKDNLLELVNYQSPKTEFAFNKEGYYRQELPKQE